MTTLSTEDVCKRALVSGGSMSWVQLLRSETIARQVAERVWRYLHQSGYSHDQREQLVHVRRSPVWHGTWLVRVMLPGIQLSDTMRDGEAAYQRHRDVAIDALRASFTPSDLVDGWSNDNARHTRGEM